MARPSLKANVERASQQERAASIARRIAPAPDDADDAAEYETVSYHLPVELIEMVRDLAEARVRAARAAKRQARRRGEKGPDARRSASAVIKEALLACRADIEAETKKLRGD